MIQVNFQFFQESLIFFDFGGGLGNSNHFYPWVPGNNTVYVLAGYPSRTFYPSGGPTLSMLANLAFIIISPVHWTPRQIQFWWVMTFPSPNHSGLYLMKKTLRCNAGFQVKAEKELYQVAKACHNVLISVFSHPVDCFNQYQIKCTYVFSFFTDA